MNSQKNVLAYLALVVISIVWGTTYFALRIGVANFPPFLFSAIRQVLAGGSLLVLLRLSGKLRIERRTLFKQFLAGILLITFGNGIMGLSERYIPSGLAALIGSIMPVYIVAINYFAGTDTMKPNAFTYTGLLSGSAGIVLIFKDNLKDFANTEYLPGMLIAFGACFCWAYGSVFAKGQTQKGHALSNAAFQMLSGGSVLFVMSLFFDNYSELKVIHAASVQALAYLVVIGSVLAYPCYLYALERLPIGLVSLFAYINPLVALLLGYIFLDEVITRVTMLAFCFISAAAYFINRGYKTKNTTT